MDSEVPSMALSGIEPNRFERMLLRVALVLAGLLILARVGSIVVLTFFHHIR
jgi:hypothetical protein